MQYAKLTDALASVIQRTAIRGGGTFALTVHVEPGYRSYTLEYPQAGFVVGGAACSMVKGTAFEPAEVRHWLTGLPGALATSRGAGSLRPPRTATRVYTFGTWRDSQTGKWWLDAVTILPVPMDGPEGEVVARERATLGAAIRLAEQRRELAIWSLHEAKEYRTKGPHPLSVLLAGEG